MSRELSSWQRTSRFQQFLVIIIATSLLSITYFHSLTARTIYLEESGDPGSIDGINITDGLNVTTRILLVSAMFPLSKSKHSVEDYISWFSMFLGPITTDIYFYTPPNFSPNIQKARGEGLPITIDTSYASPFDIPPLMGLEEKYQKMHKKDREMFRHSPELYAIWNAKPFFLDSALQILQRQGKVYDYAFSTDAGSFRENYAFKDWPEAPPDFSCAALKKICARIIFWRFSERSFLVVEDVLRLSRPPSFAQPLRGEGPNFDERAFPSFPRASHKS